MSPQAEFEAAERRWEAAVRILEEMVRIHGQLSGFTSVLERLVDELAREATRLRRMPNEGGQGNE